MVISVISMGNTVLAPLHSGRDEWIGKRCAVVAQAINLRFVALRLLGSKSKNLLFRVTGFNEVPR